MRRARTMGVALAAALGACGAAEEDAPPSSRVAAADTVLVNEAWVASLDTMDNIDGPTVYHGADGAHWIIASAKGTHVLVVYDALTGRTLRRIGSPGKGAGQLARPNGVLVLGDSLLLVVERDNGRVQGFRLPSFAPAGSFGEGLLRLPYGITAFAEGSGEYRVYVTDNYETPDEEVPPLGELGERVKWFRVRLAAGRLQATHMGSFGDTTAAGAIRVTESIFADPANDRLVIAEELETDSHLKVYTLDGRYTGQDFGRGYFPQQAEGIALYACGDSAGYWVTTDQGDDVNTFHLFDRSTLAHVSAFTGPVTRRTDGVALTQRAFEGFPAGAFLTAHLDAAISAFSWADIAASAGVRSDCRPG